MKKLLLFFLCVLVTIGTKAEIADGVITTTAENLQSEVNDWGGDSDGLEKLVITSGEVTQDILDYMAEKLKDLKKVDLTNATLSDGTRLTDDITVNWEELVLPTSTKISPSFKRYSNLKYAMVGDFTKIWLVSQRGKEGATDAFSSIIDCIPKEIKNKPATDRICVAFVGEVTVDDVKSVVGYDANWKAGPLINARIWHFDAATGLKPDNFKTLAEATPGNNDNPTGFVLPRGMSLDGAYSIISTSNCAYKIGNVYVLSEDGGTLSVQINKTNTFDIEYLTVANTEMAILKGGDKVTVNDDIINALKGTKRVESVDLSGMSFENSSDAKLHEVTEGNVKLVTLPSGIFDPDTYEGTTFGAVEYGSDASPLAVTYQRVPGTLNKMRKYRSANILERERIRYRGMMNMHDLENLFTDEKNVYYDLSDVRVVKYVNGEADEDRDPKDFNKEMVTDRTEEDGLDMSVIKNIHVKYIALPMKTHIPEDVNKFKEEKCPSLLNIGAFEKETGKLSFHSFEEGSTKSVMDMFLDDSDKITEDTKVKHLVMSGKLKFCDIAASQDYFLTDGHCDYNMVKTAVSNMINDPNNVMVVSSETEETNDATKPYPAFSTGDARLNMALETCDFTNAIFPVQTDMVFFAAGRYANLTEIKLPTSTDMTMLPEGCISGMKNVISLCVPANYTTIERGAFYLMTGLTKITTTAVQEGNITDRGEGTIVLSYNLKEIKTGAFWGIEKMNDIYVLAETAPKCESGAFGEAMCYGYNGFKNVHPVCRDNYENQGRIIGILHYPRVCVGTDEELKYTDITRNYTLLDETGATNGIGELIKWPKHEEFGRSWNQARQTVEGSDGTLAYTWNGWKEFNVDESSGAKSLIRTYNEALAAGGIDNTYTYDTDYMGWHEFVLAESYHRKATAEEQTRDYSRFKENDWYTFCVPYNLTRSMLRDILGAPAGSQVTVKGNDGKEETITAGDEGLYPDVRTLVQVKRDRNNSLVTFVFSDNLTEKECGGAKGSDVALAEDGQTYSYVVPEYVGENNDDPIIIKGGYPYIIKPYLPAEKLGLEKYLVDIPTVGNSPVGYCVSDKAKTSTAAPYPNHKVHAIDVNKSTAEKTEYVYLENDESKAYFYHFIGTYAYKDSYVPQYSFFLAAQKGTGRHMFFRATTNTRTWPRYSAIMAGRSEGSIIITDDAASSNEEITNIYLDFSCDNDYFGADSDTGIATQAKVALEFGDGSETTGITEITGNTESDNARNNNVYSISGRYMGTSTDALPKGVYIVNGRKMIIR